MSKEAPIIVGLDIGTTKIAAIAGRKNEFGKLEILGFGRADSFGVQHGMVLNIDQTIKAIQMALEDCYSTNPDLEINEVFVGIAGHHIKSLQTRGDIVRNDTDSEISQSEIDQLIRDQYKTYVPAGDKIIDVIPQVYKVDSISNIINPIGMPGVKVGADFHIITGDKNAIRNINRSVEKSKLTIKDLVLQPLASASAVMCKQDLETGVAIVDIGGGTTDIAVFYEGILKHTAVIPYGGENITNDIKKGLGVLKSQAEQMKIQCGSALADEAKSDLYITIPGLRGQQSKEISVKNLSHIIQARMEEILDFVGYNLKQAGLNNKSLNGGIILTGGGSQLKHLVQLTEYSLGVNARIGYPNEHLSSGYQNEKQTVEYLKELSRPMYSTCVGLILKGYNDYENGLKLEENRSFKSVNHSFDKQQTAVNDTFPENETEDGTIIDERDLPGHSKVEGLNIGSRKTLKKFMDSMKRGLIDLFREEEDSRF